MTFRTRVFVLVSLVALVATGASTYLTLAFARSEAARSTQSQQLITQRITSEITKYGRNHGTWERVAALAERLARQTDRRIRLETEELREIIVDTAVLLNQPVPPSTGLSVSIDARPRFEPAGLAGGKARAVLVDSIERYRQETRVAACLTRHEYDPVATSAEYGVPVFDYADVPAEVIRACWQGAVSIPEVLERDRVEAARCATPIRSAVVGSAPVPSPSSYGAPAASAEGDCLRETFVARIGAVGPVPLLVTVGQGPNPFSVTPIAVAVGVATLLIVLGTFLLSRHVLRPIRGLTIAAHRLGQGSLDQRVAVAGGDELGGLAATFNRMADSLQRSEERQRRMISDIAHELRTPLSNLRSYLEALQDGLVTPDPALFQSLHDETMLQQRIVDDLQTLAMAEAGELRYDWAPVVLGDLLESCRTAQQPSARAASVTLAVVADPAVVLQADADRLRQALGNLVTNSVRHSPPGSTVILEVAQVGQDAQLRVIDQGSGIAPGDQPRVFDRFWRGDRARRRSSGGSGLGLAITRQIVLDHGGEISLTSRVGEGTTFIIRLPMDGPDHR
ncbi:sensor histidine kinase [Catellatospora citrea]|uniref:Signal transduction histidine-protein kinase/phosphatase MprB n=1 Tax=Catellatospora citrea TaxID=53366 RepID=A0A8J3KSH8_9ACTN|nr:HAMP domain-containing sensor histidine kinase [Catellatospora citrea]RKE10703.1 two-component system sensor histidine kinase BaeS [Catellatospora citrea]GIG01165.1 hypothetical protein Cci01nite_62580 [Catellatospora citrea]